MTEKLSDKYPAYQVATNLDVETAREALQAAAIDDQNCGDGSHHRANWAARYGQRLLNEIIHQRAMTGIPTSAGLEAGAVMAAEPAQFTLRQLGEISFNDPEDEGPVTGLVLEGDHAAVRAAAALFGEKVCVVAATAYRSALIPPSRAGEAVARCCSAASPCSWQRHHGMDSVCPTCTAAAGSPAPQAVAPTGEIGRLTYGEKLIAEAIEAHFGERNDDYDEDVDDTSNHGAWEAFDAATAQATDLRRKLEDARKALAEARDHINRYADTAVEHDLIARIDAITSGADHG